MKSITWIYVTCESVEQAKKIGKAVVERRLATCANILPGMESIYWWNGKLEEGQESVLIFKTTADLVEQLTEAVKELHNYEVPCVISLPVQAGNPDYLRWIEQETIRTTTS